MLVQFEVTSMILLKPKLHNTKFNYQLIIISILEITFILICIILAKEYVLFY